MKDRQDAYSVKVEAEHVGFFETPVAYCRVKEADALIRDLETAIRQNMADSGGLKRSNIGGWHSDTDMIRWGGAAAARLADTTINVAKRMTRFQEASAEDYEWTVRMWANVTAKGGFNHMHAHPGNMWAAVLYVDMGEDGESGEAIGGEFYVEDPRFPMAAMHHTAVRLIGSDGEPQQYEIEFKLQRGNLIVFPAWLRHGVRTYHGERERISIAMNIDARCRR